MVVSAGNAGPFNGTILSPADDPLVITVGALDDLVTSGRSVVSLAAPGSTIYDTNPSARVGSANFVGSGTATAPSTPTPPRPRVR